MRKPDVLILLSHISEDCVDHKPTFWPVCRNCGHKKNKFDCNTFDSNLILPNSAFEATRVGQRIRGLDFEGENFDGSAAPAKDTNFITQLLIKFQMSRPASK